MARTKNVKSRWCDYLGQSCVRRIPVHVVTRRSLVVSGSSAHTLNAVDDPIAELSMQGVFELRPTP